MARTSPLFLPLTLISALAFAMVIAVVRAEVHPATRHAPVHFRHWQPWAALDQRQSGPQRVSRDLRPGSRVAVCIRWNLERDRGEVPCSRMPPAPPSSISAVSRP